MPVRVIGQRKIENVARNRLSSRRSPHTNLSLLLGDCNAGCAAFFLSWDIIVSLVDHRFRGLASGQTPSSLVSRMITTPAIPRNFSGKLTDFASSLVVRVR